MKKKDLKKLRKAMETIDESLFLSNEEFADAWTDIYRSVVIIRDIVEKYETLRNA